MRRIDQLTFTRFWALVLVLLYHGAGGIYTNWISNPQVIAILASAPTAVSYLYVLSGFVMSYVYYRPAEKFNIPGYWTARFVRIYPLYFLSFLLICYYYLDYIARIKPLKVLVNIFVLQAWWPPYAQSFNYASWSMTVEFFFYAIFPFFTIWAYRQTTRKLIWVSLSVWIVTQVVHYVLWIGYFPEWELFIVYNPIFHLSSFLTGVVGGIWFLREAKDKPIKQTTNLAVLLGSLGLICLYILLSDAYPALPHNLQPMSGLLAPLFTLFIVALALDQTRLSRFLNHRWLVILGETSFALYILHVPIIWIYERALALSKIENHAFIFSATYLPLMVMVGLIAYLYVDPPLRGWLRRILGRVSMPLLVLDLAAIAASVYLSFYLRFEPGREFNAYESTAVLMFWSAFIFQTAISVAFNALNPIIFQQSWLHMFRPLFISLPIGTLVVALLVYSGFASDWIENFPRSVILIDLGLLLGFTMLNRMVIRVLGFYTPNRAAG